MKLKYVVFDNNEFVIFPPSMVHADVTQNRNVVGAGFCNFARKADSDEANCHCWGESISLGVESREEDEDIINRALAF